MKVSIAYRKEDSQFFLAFNRKLSQDENVRLRELGFKISLTQPSIGFATSNSAGNTWFVPDHKVYRDYLSTLQEELDKGIGLEEIPIHPSYEPSEQNLKHNHFSYVTFTLTNKEFEDWIVFEPFKRVATAIALTFGRKRFGDRLMDVSVLPRKEKTRAKILMAKGRVIQTEQKKLVEADSLKPDEEDEIGTYNDYAVFKVNVIDQLVLQGELTTSDAQKILMIPENERYIKSQLVDAENPNQSLAAKVANEVLERYVPKEFLAHPDDPLANEHGVYVAELAGDNYEEIEIPFPKNAKFKAFIKIAKGSDNLYRFGLSTQNLTGDWSSFSFAPSIGSPTYPNKQEALEAGFKQLTLEQNEKIINVIKAFARERGVELDQEQVFFYNELTLLIKDRLDTLEERVVYLETHNRELLMELKTLKNRVKGYLKGARPPFNPFG